MKGVQFSGFDVHRAEADEQADHCDLDRDDHRVDEGGLGDADVQQPGDHRDDQYRRQVEQFAGGDELAVLPGDRRGGQRLGEGQVQGAGEETEQVGRPAHRHRGGGEQVLQYQAPADEPGHAFAQGGVGIRIGAAGNRHHRREFGVAQAGEGAGQAGEHERQHDRGAGVVGRGLAGDDEDAGADHRAHAQQDQVPGCEGALERGFALQAAFDRFAGVHVCGRLDRFDPQQCFEHSLFFQTWWCFRASTGNAHGVWQAEPPATAYLAKARPNRQAQVQHGR